MKKIITIGRQFGSGGREVGQKVAQALHIAYYDKELLMVAAKKSGLSSQFMNTYDEKPTRSFLYSLVMGQRGLFPDGGEVTVEQLAANAQRDAILSVAGEGGCVIVGRCADYVLRDEPELLRVFLTADRDDRIRRVCRRSGGEAGTDGPLPRGLLPRPVRSGLGRGGELRPVHQCVPLGRGRRSGDHRGPVQPPVKAHRNSKGPAGIHRQGSACRKSLFSPLRKFSMAQDTLLGFPAHTLPCRCGEFTTLSTASGPAGIHRQGFVYGRRSGQSPDAGKGQAQNPNVATMARTPSTPASR